MPNTTPNIGLFMKDPNTDGNTTFDIKTMLNDNFEKIDGEFGDVVYKRNGALAAPTWNPLNSASLGVLDSRTLSYTPEEYPMGISSEFKNCSDIGLPVGTYADMVTHKPYVDGSGNTTNAYQLASTSGLLFVRHATSQTAWGVWDSIWTDNAMTIRSAVVTGMSANQALSASVYTRIAFNAEFRDNLSEFNPTTYEFKPKAVVGLYLVNLAVGADLLPNDQFSIFVNINGNRRRIAEAKVTHTAQGLTVTGTALIEVNAGDTVTFDAMPSPTDRNISNEFSSTYLYIVRVA